VELQALKSRLAVTRTANTLIIFFIVPSDDGRFAFSKLALLPAWPTKCFNDRTGDLYPRG
jgi:hypothetical protein